VNQEPADLDRRAAEAQPHPPARLKLDEMTSDQLDHLYDRLDKLAQTIAAFPDANDAANLAHARAQRDTFLARAQHAEAAVVRVRAECERLTHLPPVANNSGRTDTFDCGARWTIRMIRSALDQPTPGPGPAATQATDTESCSPPATETEPNNPDRLAQTGVLEDTATTEPWPTEGWPWTHLLDRISDACTDPGGRPPRTTAERIRLVWAVVKPELEMFRAVAQGRVEEITPAPDEGYPEPPAPEWTPPPPGSTREQLPDHILDIARPHLPDYLSTACQTADTVACAACYPRSGTPRPQYDELRAHAERLHNRCLNHEFTGQLCVCGCHPTEETP
jgi:hypothetical protein